MAEPGSSDYGGMSEAQRNAIVQALLAQAYQQQSAPTMYGDSAAGDPYAYPTDPSDPDAQAPGLSAPLDSIANPTANDLTAATFDALSNQAPADTMAQAATQQSVNETANAQQNAMENSTLNTDVASALNSISSPGLPAGFFNTGFNTPGETISGPPAQTAFDQGLTLGGLNIAGYNMAPAFNAFEGAAPAATGYGSPAAFAAADQAMSVANDAMAAQMSDALAGYSVTGTPATGTPASTAVSVGYGVGLGLGDAVGGGFSGGFGGEGDAGGVGNDGGGVGIGGASTGISGGPGGSGEGGANTGEGGVGDGAGGGGSGGGAGK